MFSVYYRVFNRNSSFCNNHCDPCFGETTRARYDCISIKTWGCFISMCILKVVLSSFFFLYSQQIKNICIHYTIIWQVHQRNGSQSCIDGAKEKKYILLWSIQFLHQPKTLPYIILLKIHSVSIHANNYLY